MAKTTATIERYHVYGTPNYCVALFHRGSEYTPKERDAHGHASTQAQWIPADAEGVELLRQHAKSLGFTHVRFAGDWSKQTKPAGGKL